MSSEKPDLLTTGQAAKLCAVTPDTVLKWIKKGKLNASRTAGGHYRVALPDLEPFLAEFGQNDQERVRTQGRTPTNGNQPSSANTEDDPPCWEFLADGGELNGACRNCVVYRVRATRCFLMAGLESDVGHAREFCEGSCEDCAYYQRLKGGNAQIIFVTADRDLESQIACLDESSLNLRFARNGYEASALVPEFRPEILILDLDGLSDQGFSILDSIAADPRLPHVQVILVVPPGALDRVLQRPRHRLVVSVLEKPQVCGHLSDIVSGSLVPLQMSSARRD